MARLILQETQMVVLKNPPPKKKQWRLPSTRRRTAPGFSPLRLWISARGSKVVPASESDRLERGFTSSLESKFIKASWTRQNPWTCWNMWLDVVLQIRPPVRRTGGNTLTNDFLLIHFPLVTLFFSNRTYSAHRSSGWVSTNFNEHGANTVTNYICRKTSDVQGPSVRTARMSSLILWGFR